jgi:hypothetical protein
MDDRNQTTHVYDEVLSELIGSHIADRYNDEFLAFAAKMEQLQ